MKITRRFTNGQIKAMAVAIVGAAIVGSTLTASATDDSANNIVWTGCSSLSACQHDMSAGDGHNSGANITAIYNHYNITSGNITAMVPVTVYKTGVVKINEAVDGFANGATIGTNAYSVGRTNLGGAGEQEVKINGSINVWQRPTSTSFAASSISGWAHMSNGELDTFILSSCGNTGKATPVKPPAPKPAPKPSTPPKPTPAPTPPPTTPQPTPPPTTQPGTAECVSLTPNLESGSADTYDFTINGTTSGDAQIEGYIFTTDNGGGNQTMPEQTLNELTGQNVPAGTSLTVEGQVVSTVGTTNMIQNCSAEVSTPATPTTPPVTPTPTPSAPLPQTGPESALGGAAGLTGIGVASRAYLRSRKSLLASLRRK